MVILARQAPAQPSFSVSVRLGDFYDELSPYGEWVECRYGDCRVPRGVGAHWQPYSNGEWIYTRYGWTWVSSDPWGGDPYHYGTWDFVDRYGWVWVPGTIWAPALGHLELQRQVRRLGADAAHDHVRQRRLLRKARHREPVAVLFLPTNRFVGSNVMSVRVEPRQNGEIFRQVKHVTRFEVSGGILRNAAVPLATVQRSMSTRIETRDINSAHTTPRSISSSGVGTRGKVAIISAAREMRAARAARAEGGTQGSDAAAPAAAGHAEAAGEANAPDEAGPTGQASAGGEAPASGGETSTGRKASTPGSQASSGRKASTPGSQASSGGKASARSETSAGGRAPASRSQARAAGRTPEGGEAGRQGRRKSEKKGKKDPPGKDGRPD